MTALYIIGGLILFIVLILIFPIGINLHWNGEISISLIVGFIRFRLFPEKEQEINLDDYSKDNFRKTLSDEKKDTKPTSVKSIVQAIKDKVSAKIGEKSEVSTAVPESAGDVLRGIWRMKGILSGIVKDFAGHIKTTNVVADIRICSDNAADCALIYGTATQFCVYVREFLRTYTKWDEKENNISVKADFEGEKAEALINFDFKTNVFFTLKALLKYVTVMNENSK